MYYGFLLSRIDWDKLNKFTSFGEFGRVVKAHTATTNKYNITYKL